MFLGRLQNTSILFTVSNHVWLNALETRQKKRKEKSITVKEMVVTLLRRIRLL